MGGRELFEFNIELSSTAWSRATVSVPTKAAEGQPNLAALIPVA